MVSLSASSLLKVWELGTSQLPCRQALLLLGVADPATDSTETLERLPIGQRDSRLLTLREKLFGRRLESVIDCPACLAPLEFSCEVDQLRVTNDTAADEMLSVVCGNLEVMFRLPNSQDVIEALSSDSADPERQLLHRCVTAVRRDDRPISSTPLPDAVVAEIIKAWHLADRQGNIELDLSCPACTHRWTSTFDIVSYLWIEVDAWAQRMLGDVHVLASAYGWREADILDMTVSRRKFYLDRVLQ